MVVTVVLSGLFGLIGAWAASSIEGRGRSGRVIAGFFFVALVAALALPLILHAAAWESTAGKFGWLVLTQTGSRSTAIGAFGAFGGLIAAGWIHGLFGAAMVALATWYGVRRIPASVIAESEMDLSPLAAWWQVRLPIAMPWLLISLLGAATLAASEMTVVDLYGFRTIADEFYRYHATTATWKEILVACILPGFLVSIGMFLLVRRRRKLIGVTASEQGSVRAESRQALSPVWHVIACVLAVAIGSMIVVTPISGLLIKAGHQIVVEGDVRTSSWSWAQFADTVGRAPVTFVAEYKWTVLIATLTAVVAVPLAFIFAAVGRFRSRLGTGFDLASLVLVVIPGPIVGLTVVRFFQLDVPGFRIAYQQTLGPTVIALLVRAGPVAYWVLRAGYQSIDDRVFAAASLDHSWIRRWWSIDLPLLGRSVFGAFLASAIVASGDVPALLPVIPPGVTTVGTRLFELLHNGARYQEAALALWYVAAIIVIVAVWLRSTRASRARL